MLGSVADLQQGLRPAEFQLATQAAIRDAGSMSDYQRHRAQAEQRLGNYVGPDAAQAILALAEAVRDVADAIRELPRAE